MPEIEFDLTSLQRAAQHVIETGTTMEVGHQIGDALGKSLLERIAGHVVVVRHESAPPSRDQLAAMAMQGILAGGRDDQTAKGFVAGLVRHSYWVADAMVEGRSSPRHVHEGLRDLLADLQREEKCWLEADAQILGKDKAEFMKQFASTFRSHAMRVEQIIARAEGGKRSADEGGLAMADDFTG